MQGCETSEEKSNHSGFEKGTKEQTRKENQSSIRKEAGTRKKKKRETRQKKKSRATVIGPQSQWGIARIFTCFEGSRVLHPGEHYGTSACASPTSFTVVSYRNPPCPWRCS